MSDNCYSEHEVSIRVKHAHGIAQADIPVLYLAALLAHHATGF